MVMLQAYDVIQIRRNDDSAGRERALKPTVQAIDCLSHGDAMDLHAE
jgi:hypothetical protein